jgi:hypothetical protein
MTNAAQKAAIARGSSLIQGMNAFRSRVLPVRGQPLAGDLPFRAAAWLLAHKHAGLQQQERSKNSNPSEFEDSHAGHFQVNPRDGNRVNRTHFAAAVNPAKAETCSEGEVPRDPRPFVRLRAESAIKQELDLLMPQAIELKLTCSIH